MRAQSLRQCRAVIAKLSADQRQRRRPAANGSVRSAGSARLLRARSAGRAGDEELDARTRVRARDSSNNGAVMATVPKALPRRWERRREVLHRNVLACVGTTQLFFASVLLSFAAFALRGLHEHDRR